MKQTVLVKPGRFETVDVPEPAPAEGEALLRVHSVGICGTDVHAFAGKHALVTYPRVLGHEVGAEIVEIGPNDRGLEAGDRVAVDPYMTCGQCYPCGLGRTNCCQNLQCMGVHFDGAMRTLTTLPVSQLHKSDSLDYDNLALVEMLGVGAHGCRRAGIRAGECVAVIGAGPIGLGAMLFATYLGAEVVAIDLAPNRLAFAESMGIAHTIDASTTDPANALADLTDGRMPPVVMDATGSVGSMGQAPLLASFAGRVVFVGLSVEPLTIDPESVIHVKELTVMGSRNSCGIFPEIIEMLESGGLDGSRLITRRFGPAAIEENIKFAADPANGVIKSILKMA